jgi:hypothetical protein
MKLTLIRIINKEGKTIAVADLHVKDADTALRVLQRGVRGCPTCLGINLVGAVTCLLAAERWQDAEVDSYTVVEVDERRK